MTESFAFFNDSPPCPQTKLNSHGGNLFCQKTVFCHFPSCIPKKALNQNKSDKQINFDGTLVGMW